MECLYLAWTHPSSSNSQQPLKNAWSSESSFASFAAVSATRSRTKIENLRSSLDPSSVVVAVLLAAHGISFSTLDILHACCWVRSLLFRYILIWTQSNERSEAQQPNQPTTTAMERAREMEYTESERKKKKQINGKIVCYWRAATI